MLVEELSEAIGRAHGSALDDVTRALWAAVGAEQIGEEEAGHLLAAIEARRLLGSSLGGPKLIGAIRLRPVPQRSPDRAKALERSRRWAAAGRIPPNLACKFTPGEQSALAVIALEVSKRGFCDKSIGELATVAGVSESTVKRAVRQASTLGLLIKQERRLSRYRNETNIVRIISKAWTSWLELRGKGGGVQPRSGTSTRALERPRSGAREETKKAIDREAVGAAMPRAQSFRLS